MMIQFVVSLRYLSVAFGFRSSSDMELFLEGRGSVVLCEEQRESMVRSLCLRELGWYSRAILLALKKMLALQTLVAIWICSRRSQSKVCVRTTGTAIPHIRNLRNLDMLQRWGRRFQPQFTGTYKRSRGSNGICTHHLVGLMTIFPGPEGRAYSFGPSLQTASYEGIEA